MASFPRNFVRDRNLRKFDERRVIVTLNSSTKWPMLTEEGIFSPGLRFVFSR